MLVHIDKIEFKIWNTEQDREDGETCTEDGTSAFWGGSKIGTLEDVSSIVVRMAKNNACAEASHNGDLIYHSSSNGEENEVSAWNNLLETEVGKKTFNSLIASPLEVARDKTSSKQGKWGKDAQRLIDFLEAKEIIVQFIDEVENIGNDEVLDLLCFIESGELVVESIFHDEHILQWDCTVTDVNWKEMNSLFEKEV